MCVSADRLSIWRDPASSRALASWRCTEGRADRNSPIGAGAGAGAGAGCAAALLTTVASAAINRLASDIGASAGSLPPAMPEGQQ
eukprot:COSAG02_NODE_305_length_25176_cov_30.787455_10_plen_85_part_00